LRTQVFRAPIQSLMWLEDSARIRLPDRGTEHHHRLVEAKGTRRIVVMEFAPHRERHPLGVA
jgi:hypothetical protein